MPALLSEQLFAWVTTSPDGETSMIGAITEFGHTPLVTVRESLAVGPMRRLAVQHQEATGQPVWLVRYGAEGVLEHLGP